MKKIILYFMIFLLCPLVLQAKVPWQSNKLREKKKMEKIEEAINQIPIYEEKLTGDYIILGPVRGQDILSKKRTAIFRQMREQAYKMQADAIMEMTCKPMLKSIFQSCEGFAIKYD